MTFSSINIFSTSAVLSCVAGISPHPRQSSHRTYFLDGFQELRRRPVICDDLIQMAQVQEWGDGESPEWAVPIISREIDDGNPIKTRPLAKGICKITCKKFRGEGKS